MCLYPFVLSIHFYENFQESGFLVLSFGFIYSYLLISFLEKKEGGGGERKFRKRRDQNQVKHLPFLILKKDIKHFGVEKPNQK